MKCIITIIAASVRCDAYMSQVYFLDTRGLPKPGLLFLQCNIVFCETLLKPAVLLLRFKFIKM